MNDIAFHEMRVNTVGSKYGGLAYILVGIKCDEVFDI